MAVLTSRRRYTNVAPAATVLAPLNASATTFGISTGTGFPAVPFTATIDYESPAEEVILVTGLSGTTVTGCTRGYDGSTAQTHAAGATFVHTAVAKDYDEANDHTSSTAAHGTTGGLVGLTDVQTVTNKTISSSLNKATATDPAAKLQAFTSGVASLIDAYDPTLANVLFKVGRNGEVVINPNDTSKIGLLIKAVAAAAVNLFEIQNSAAAKLWIVNQAGRIIQKPTDTSAAAYKYVPPNTASVAFLNLRDTTDATDQFILTTDGAITTMSKAWMRGFFTDDVLRFPLDGSLFKVDSTGVLTAPTVITSDVVKKVGYASGTGAGPAAAGTEAKDTDVGDVSFVAVAGRKYRFVYHARMGLTAFTTAGAGDFRIRDGGASSPTAASTLLCGASAHAIPSAAGSDSNELRVEQVVSGLTAGTHIVAAFVARTAGGSSIQAQNALGQARELIVYDEGTF